MKEVTASSTRCYSNIDIDVDVYWADVLKVKFCVMLVFFVWNWNQENKRKGDEREIKRKGDENISYNLTQAAFTCSKLTIETLEQGVGYAQS